MTLGRSIKTAGRLLAGALLASIATSCASGGPAPAAGGPAPGPGPEPAGERAAAVLPGSESGLLIRQWRIADEPSVVANALMRYARGEGGDPALRGVLERNGFRLVRIAAADTETLLDDLGGSSLDIDGWHGQAYDWRALAAKSLGPGGRAVAVNGHVRRFSGGRMRLMMRGWTMQTEVGPFVYVELQPDFDQSRQSRLTNVLARPRFIGERFDSMGLELMLEEGYAYVLTTAAPGEDWTRPGGPGAGEAPAPEAPGPDAGAGPGPATGALPTVGEVLLRTDQLPPRLDVLVLVPRIPPSMYPSARRAPSGAEASR